MKRIENISNWANRHQALFGLAGVMLGVALTLGGTWYVSQPTYFPTSMLLTDAEERPVERLDLSDESQACDGAVRSMLLAFAAEDENPEGPTFGERVSSAVESPYAIIPAECRLRIDGGFVFSANGVKAELKSARVVEDRVAIAFVFTNASKRAYSFGFDYYTKPELMLDRGRVGTLTTKGLPSCIYCISTNYSSGTIKIDSGRSVLIHIEGNLIGAERPATASIIVPVFRWTDMFGDREIRISFNDIPLAQGIEDDETDLGDIAAQP